MKILVAGATGRVGHYLVEQLAEAGHEVRALTRNAAKAKFSPSVVVVEGDLTQPQTLVTALEGVEALHLVNFGGDDYAPLQTGAEIVALAQQAGVKRVTVLRGAEENGTVENALEASKMAWTYLQPVEFMSGVLDWAATIRAESKIRMGFVHRQSAIVHDADIAAVALVALTNEGHGGQSYVITGGEVLTPLQMVAEVSKAIGRDIKVIELSEAEAREQWRSEGFPDEVIEFFVWVQGNTPQVGYTTTQTIQEVTGRPPRTMAQWAIEHRNEFC